MSAPPDTPTRQPDTSPRHEGDDGVRVSPEAVSPEAVSPEDASTGPVLEWSEIELDFPRGLGLWATSDGRVAAAGAQFAAGYLSGPYYAVGTDFVIAMVTPYLSAAQSGDTGSQFPETRWFIARVL